MTVQLSWCYELLYRQDGVHADWREVDDKISYFNTRLL